MAERFGQTSTAERLKVGCLIVNEGGILAEGCNGMPPNWFDEICEDRFYFDEEMFWLFDGSQIVSSETLLKASETHPHNEDGRFYRLVTKNECRHAEVAALEKLWNKTATSRGAMMFISHSPCYACSIKIVTAGIKEVYYKHDYRSSDGIQHLSKNGVKVTKIKLED